MSELHEIVTRARTIATNYFTPDEWGEPLRVLPPQRIIRYELDLTELEVLANWYSFEINEIPGESMKFRTAEFTICEGNVIFRIFSYEGIRTN